MTRLNSQFKQVDVRDIFSGVLCSNAAANEVSPLGTSRPWDFMHWEARCFSVWVR